MGSSGKKKTTMAKLTRERKLRERRLDKQSRKEARKLAAAEGPPVAEMIGPDGEPIDPAAWPPADELESADAPQDVDAPQRVEAPQRVDTPQPAAAPQGSR